MGWEGSRSPTSYFPFPPLLSLSPHVAGPIGGALAPCGLVCSLTWPIKPISLPGVPGTPFGDPVPPEHFRCPNTIVLYMNLYLSTILRLLVMSVISSGTLNNIRLPNHITLYRQRTLSVQTLRVRELCRHDRDTSLVNNR